MNGSAWVILALAAAGLGIYFVSRKGVQTVMAGTSSSSGTEETTSTPIQKAVHLDISSQVKTGAGPLSFSDVTGYASDAGFAGGDLVNIVAICFAESSGNPDALNSNGTVAPKEGSATDVYSVGLWQINLKAHPKYQQANLFDPVVNASAAFEIFSSQGLKAWGGYTSGNYRAYLDQANGAVNV